MNPETLVTKALEYNIFFGLLVFLIIAIIIFFYKDRQKNDEAIHQLVEKLDAKNASIIELQGKHNERLLAIQQDMIQAMNNQTIAIKGVEVILQSMRDDIERLK